MDIDRELRTRGGYKFVEDADIGGAPVSIYQKEEQNRVYVADINVPGVAHTPIPIRADNLDEVDRRINIILDMVKNATPNSVQRQLEGLQKSSLEGIL